MSSKNTRRKVKEAKAKGFQEVYTLQNFTNVPSLITRALAKQRKELGIPNATPMPSAPVPTTPTNLTAHNKRLLEQSIVRALYNNNSNNFPKNLFANNANRSRSGTMASDPRSPSPKGGRRTRRRRRGCRF